MVQLRVVPIIAALCCPLLAADGPIFLRRNLFDVVAGLGVERVDYQALFGEGDQDADELRTVARYGRLTIDPGASSPIVSYPAEEQIYFITEGHGTLLYADQKAPVKKNDFAYLPVGVRHGIGNSSAAPVKVIVMGYRIPADIKPQPTPQLMLASADDVPLQVLSGHGPTTQFKLLMGLTSSTRDKLAAAYVMDSLFIMDFAPGGTNIPHHHPAEEEIYLLLRGSGDMVAGLDADGKEVRHPVTAGAAFFFKPGTQVGYYSKAREGQEHDLILAARSRLPRR